MWKAARLTIIAFMLALVLTMAGAQTGWAKDTLTVAFTTDSRSFDPSTATRDFAGYATVGALYDWLVQYEKVTQADGTVKVDTTQVVPMLAERLEQRRHVGMGLYLRKNAKFHRQSVDAKA
jgi:ABC-type transport system substrate-binding protein